MGLWKKMTLIAASIAGTYYVMSDWEERVEDWKNGHYKEAILGEKLATFLGIDEDEPENDSEHTTSEHTDSEQGDEIEYSDETKNAAEEYLKKQEELQPVYAEYNKAKAHLDEVSEKCNAFAYSMGLPPDLEMAQLDYSMALTKKKEADKELEPYKEKYEELKAKDEAKYAEEYGGSEKDDVAKEDGKSGDEVAKREISGGSRNYADGKSTTREQLDKEAASIADAVTGFSANDTVDYACQA